MGEPKVGVVGVPGKWSTEALADALEARTGHRLVLDMAEVGLDLTTGTLRYRGESLSDLSALVVKKISAVYDANALDRLELLRAAEQRGVRVFSPVRSMLGLIDRLSCTVTLAGAGIPMPPTRITEDLGEAKAAVREFGSAVLKPLFSTKARGMIVVDAREPESEIETKLETFRSRNPMLYIQKRIELPGRDLGMVFLAGRYLGTYARVGKGDAWNTTIASGGRYEAFEPEASLVELAHAAQAPFDLDFTTVDVAESSEGPVVFEVSAFGGFRGALEGIGIDAASLYADHVIRELKANQELPKP